MLTTVEHPLVISLRQQADKAKNFLTNRERSILWISAVIFIIVFTALGAWKLWSFGYSGLDLAIYNQVATNSVQGNWFQFSIHPHSYLGDHLELFFAVLWPIYAIAQHPLTLIVLQALALAITVWPLSQLTKFFLPLPWSMLLALSFLANPIVQNMALFEFHLLPFAIPLISFALLAYVRQRFGTFLLWSVLAMTVREDVSLVIVGFSILALVDRRHPAWFFLPAALGIGWFIFSMKLTAYFSGYPTYKFLVYYSWLGKTLSGMIINALSHPWLVLRRLLTWSNAAFLAALFLPWAYLPLRRLRWLIPVILTLIQLLLVEAAGEILLDIHYPSLLLPFMIVAAADTFRLLLHPPTRGLFAKLARERVIIITILGVVMLYTMLVIGPLARTMPVLAKTIRVPDRIQLEHDILATVPNGGVVAGFDSITHFSNRPDLHSLHYVFLGKKQFSEEAFIVPDTVETVVLELRDFLFYQVLYRFDGSDNRRGYQRIRDLLQDRGFVPVLYLDRFAIFRRGESVEPLYTMDTFTDSVRSIHGNVQFHGWMSADGLNGAPTTNVRTVAGNQYRTIPLYLTFSKTRTSDEIYQLDVRIVKNGRTAWRTLYPLGSGMFPTSDWPVGTPVTSRYELLLPHSLADKQITLDIRVILADGTVGLNGARSLEIHYDRYEVLGPVIELGRIQVDRTR